MADDKMEYEGEVLDACKGKFTIRVNDGYNVMCTLSGKIRQNSVRILIGDTVKIEVTPYDPSKGRIVYRIK